MGVTINAVEEEGDFTYINDTENEYFDLKSGSDADGNALEWGVWEAEGQYKGDQTFAYGYPQEMEEPEDGWTMPTLTFAFKGTYVGIISVCGDDQGWMDIILDGEYKATVRSIANEAVDYEPILEEAPSSLLIWEMDGHADAQHILTIQPSNQIDEEVTWSKCNVDAIVVKGTPIKVEDVDPNATFPPTPEATPTPTPEPTPTPTEKETEEPTEADKTPEKTESKAANTTGQDDDKIGGSTWLIVVIVLVVLAGGTGLYFLVARKRKNEG